MIEHEVLWALLPDGLEQYFDIEGYEKDELKFRVVLIEKDIVPENLPEKYHKKKVINTVLSSIIIDDFPIRGRKGEIVLKRRSWKFKDIPEMFSRNIELCANGTKLEKEFADFLKEMDRA